MPRFQHESLYKNSFDLHRNEPVEITLVHKNGFAQRLVFTQRQKGTLKWLIISTSEDFNKLYWECVCTNVSKVVKNKKQKQKERKEIISQKGRSKRDN